MTFGPSLCPGPLGSLGVQSLQEAILGAPGGGHRVEDPCDLQLVPGEVWEQIPAWIFSPLPRDMNCGGSPQTLRRALAKRAALPRCSRQRTLLCMSPRTPRSLLGPSAFATCVLGMTSDSGVGSVPGEVKASWKGAGPAPGTCLHLDGAWEAGEHGSGGLDLHQSQLQVRPHRGWGALRLRRFRGGGSPGG